MREIKFRVWDKVSNLMRPSYGVLGKIEFGQDGNPYRIGVYEYMQMDEEGNGDWHGFELEQDQFEIMQYTGLKDKNGKEIYEGDILKNTCHPSQGVVMFRHGVFGINYDSEFSHIAKRNVFEIIGNIYEHPNLLEGK